MSKDANVTRLEDYQAPMFLIEKVSLTFRLLPEATRVTSVLSIVPGSTGQTGEALVLDGDALTFLSARMDGKALEAEQFTVASDHFTLLNPPSRPFTLEIVTQIEPSSNTCLMGLYQSNGTYCTQCEAEGFRRITYFLDRPDILALYDVRIEAPKSVPFLLSNGNLVGKGPMPTPDDGAGEEDWHYALWSDPHPKPSYLFALVAGDLARIEDQFTTCSGRVVALHIYVEHGKEDRVGYAMDALKRSMKWDEETFGREYDLDIFMIVAVSDFNMGAMENKGLNIFNDKYVLARPDTATDTDYALIEAVIAHEYFHNWTGNRITCRDWFQLCLKEGLTVYRDQEFSSDMRSRPVKRIADVRQLRSRQFPEDSGPLAHPVRPEAYSEINNFYTATVYEKGAELVRMLKLIVGDANFAKGLDLFFARFDGQAVTVEDFLGCFADASGRDLKPFSLWYSQAGTPNLVATYSHDPIRSQLHLTIEQSCPPTPGQPTKRMMQIPIRFGLVGRNGGSVPYSACRDIGTGKTTHEADGSLIELTDQQHKFVFENVEQEAIPSLLRAFSAPVHLRSNLTKADHLCLMHHDPDAFNRWEATQFILMDHLIRQTRANRTHSSAGSARPVNIEVIEALKATALDEGLEHAFRAQMLHIPSEADIAREIGKDVDPDAIHSARESLCQSIASVLSEPLHALYRELEDTAAYAPDAAFAGRRSLRNTLLDLLLASGQEAMQSLAHKQYEEATNMTDRFAALASLTLRHPASAAPLLEDFHERYEGDALVIDKWLSLQATVPFEGTIERIEALMRHPSFTASNPNRVRALVGAFAMNNAIQFNRKDGRGFRLVADIVLQQNTTNPQTAARLANNFRSWRALERARQREAEKELKRIAESAGLSKDVADIVNRCLQ